jgi:Flp pilus assembly protein TadD
MKKLSSLLSILVWVVVLSLPGSALAQRAAINQMLNTGYDLLEQGQTSQAQKIFAAALQQDPGNPLALNNLAAVMVKEGKLKQALAYLNQALPRAKGYTVALNRVCSVEGVCAAVKAREEGFGSEDLEPVIKVNILMVQMALAVPPGRKP